jgi:hypothetical protein
MHSEIIAAVLHVVAHQPNPCSSTTVHGIPNPGTGCLPSAGFGAALQQILDWVAWIATSACVVGILTVGATMAMQHQRGRGSEHMVGLAWVLVGCILIGTSSAVVAVFAH